MYAKNAENSEKSTIKKHVESHNKNMFNYAIINQNIEMNNGGNEEKFALYKLDIKNKDIITITNYVEIGYKKNRITRIRFYKENLSEEINTKKYKKSSISDKLFTQLEEYLRCERRDFDIEYELEGTEFQKRVWVELMNIPYGDTVSYKKLAEKIGNPKACRAVGNANNKNKLPILIPCHRVVGSDKSLVGYAFGLEFKKYLLELESKF